MNKEKPEYLVINPIFSLLKKDVMTLRQNQLYRDFNGDIQIERIKIPLKLFFTGPDETNIKEYYLNDLIETSFQ